MPFRPPESLLNLNLEKMHTIDTRSVEDLHGLWNVFSKTSNALKDGKRLENMSWRLWNRETFCCCPESKRPSKTCSPSPRDVTKVSTHTSISDLASSLDTISGDERDVSEQTIQDSSAASSHIVRPELTRLDSIESRNRGSQKHISPTDLEKIVNTIQQTSALEPIDDLELPALSASPLPALVLRKESDASTRAEAGHKVNRPSAESMENSHPLEQQKPKMPTRTSTLESSTSTAASQISDASPTASGSGESSSTTMSTHNVIRGFVPGGAPSSYRSQTQLAAQPTPILKNSLSHALPSRAKAKGAMFTLGASASEEESSLDSHPYKSSMRSLSGAFPKNPEKKQASFRDENLVSKIQDSPVFESDEEDEDDELYEDVIDDDVDSDDDWEDEVIDERSLQDEPTFRRTDSRPTLTSRRSLLTTLMNEGDRAKALQNAASRSSPALRNIQTMPPQALSRAASPPRDDMSGSTPRPIAMHTNSISQHLALSPRTTRRNMLSSELTESLRKNLLWERQHRSSHNLAALKRRHTSHDVKNLRQYPDPQPGMLANENVAKFTNEYFHAGLGEYHSKGW